MQILLQPIGDGENFESTVRQQILTAEIAAMLPPDICEELDGLERLELWGARRAKKSGDHRKVWGNIAGEDIVLFIHKGQIVHLGIVILTFSDEQVARALWSESPDGRLWKDIYVLEGEDLVPPVNHRPEILGYAPNHVLRGPILLSPEKSTEMQRYLFAEFAKRPPTTEEMAEIDDIANTGALLDPSIEWGGQALWLAEKVVEKYLRRLLPSKRIAAAEQLETSNLAERVKRNAGWVCEICGQPPFEQANGKLYAEAHHVNPLGMGGPDEERNLLCVCAHCHRIIHFSTTNAILHRLETMNRLMGNIGHTDVTIRHVLPSSKRLANARRAARAIGN